MVFARERDTDGKRESCGICGRGGRLGRRGFNTINSGGSGVLGVLKLKMVADIYEERDRVEEWTSGEPGGGYDE